MTKIKSSKTRSPTALQLPYLSRSSKKSNCRYIRQRSNRVHITSEAKKHLSTYEYVGREDKHQAHHSTRPSSKQQTTASPASGARTCFSFLLDQVDTEGNPKWGEACGWSSRLDRFPHQMMSLRSSSIEKSQRGVRWSFNSLSHTLNHNTLTYSHVLPYILHCFLSQYIVASFSVGI